MRIYPDFSEFKKLSKKYSVIPVYTELLGDMETPVSSFLKIRKGAYNFLLESAEQEERTGRYSFLGTSPELIIKGKNKEVEIYNNITGEKEKVVVEKPLYVLREKMKEYKYPEIKNLPGFTGGFIGFISYDYIRQIEKIPEISVDTLNFPDFLFMFSKNLVVFDHFKRKIILISNVVVDEFSNLKVSFENGKENIFKMKEKIEKPLFLIQKGKHRRKGDFKSNFKKRDFLKAVKKVKEYIVKGDIIQAVISQRWKKKIDIEPFNLYRALRSINPSPYMFFIETGDIKLIGSSPEILVKLENRRAIVRPIAGTRRRGKDENEEKKLEEDLLNDEKEKAEHIMLVDLGRNDLGRVCIAGSVKVTDLMAIEKYSHVMHIVSNVEGKLMKGKDGFDLLEATFPAGTVSGAPKIRAMEIIEEVEPEKRGVYAGGVGYFSFQKNMDFCIAIRTFFIKGDEVFIQAGAGIVSDSVSEREYIETKNKAKGLIEAYKLAEEMEK